MSLVVVVFIGLCLYAMIRVLNLASPSLPPSIYSKTRNSEFIQAILSSCPILREPYVPPLLWGKSGHIQTVVYAKLGRVRDPIPSGTRYTKTLQDGSTLTFDIYQPDTSHPTNGDFCMLVCPGFGSSSESSYIRALVTHAQSCGYRLAVLNHLGCVFSLRLTAPRIFSYGGWEEFHIMREEVEHLYPQCKLILVGLSMGANIVIKYLGERPEHQRGIWCAISICQGYNINHAKHLLKKWQSLRRAYLYTMTANQRRLIKHHSDILFTEEARRRFGFDLKKIFSATTLEDLDLHFTCKLQGVQNVVDYYETASCSNYISNINIPLVLLNSEDDPIVPLPLLKYARDYTESHDQAALVTTKHGGHLGFFESGFFKPQITSWIDRFVCQISDAVISFTLQKQLVTAGPSSHVISLQVRTPSFRQQLETTLDAPEPEDNNLDLAIGEGPPRKAKSSSSDLLGLRKRTSLDTVSEESGESLESLCSLITDSCEVKESSSENISEDAKNSFSQQGISVSLPEIIMEGDADESTIAREDVDESSIRTEKERSEVENGRREFMEKEVCVLDYCPRQLEASTMNEGVSAESTTVQEDVGKSSVRTEKERSEVADGRRSKDFDENKANVVDYCPRKQELASAMNEGVPAESTTLQEDVDESSVRTEKERSEFEDGRRSKDVYAENKASVVDYCPRKQELASTMNEEDAAESTIAQEDVDESSVRTEKERSEFEDGRRSKDFDENEASMLDYCPRKQELPSFMNGEDTAEDVQLVYSRNKSPTERDLEKEYIASDSYAEIMAEASSAMNDNTAEKLASFQNMSLKEISSAKEHSTSKTNEEMSIRNTTSAKANSEAVRSKVPFPDSAEEQQPVSLRDEEQPEAREQRSCEAFRNCVRWGQEAQHLEETAKNPAVQSVLHSPNHVSQVLSATANSDQEAQRLEETAKKPADIQSIHHSPNHVNEVFSSTANFDQEAQPLEEAAKNQPLHHVSQVLSASTANFEEKINRPQAAASTVSAGQNQTDTVEVKSGSSLCERAEGEFSECASSVNGNTLDSHSS